MADHPIRDLEVEFDIKPPFELSASMTSVKQRFERFMLSTPGVESIDELVRPRESELTGRKRAVSGQLGLRIWNFAAAKPRRVISFRRANEVEERLYEEANAARPTP